MQGQQNHLKTEAEGVSDHRKQVKYNYHSEWESQSSWHFKGEGGGGPWLVASLGCAAAKSPPPQAQSKEMWCRWSVG